MTPVDSDSCTLLPCEFLLLGILDRLKSIFKCKSLYANKLDIYLEKCGREDGKIIGLVNY